MIGPPPVYISDHSYNGGFSKESIDELVEALDSNYLMVGAITCDYGKSERPEQELKIVFLQ
jgi:sigma-B regulation protein RsbQ